MTFRYKLLTAISFIFFTGIAGAQYSSTDNSLIKSVYSRVNKDGIVNQYLKSSNVDSVTAGLLAAANIGDTALVGNVISAYDSNPYFTAYTLGALGKNSNSATFLFSKLSEANTSEVKSILFQAIGQTGELSDLLFLIKEYKASERKHFAGISKAIFQFSQRGITDSGTTSVLMNEISLRESDIFALSDILYTAARILPAKALAGFGKGINKALINYYDDPSAGSIVQYALAIARKGKFDIPDDVIGKLSKSNNPLIRIESAKFFSTRKLGTSELFLFSVLLRDEIVAVATQAATGCANLQFTTPELKESFKKELRQIIAENKVEKQTATELLKSFYSLYPDGLDEFIAQKETVTTYPEVYAYFLSKYSEKYFKQGLKIIQDFEEFSPGDKIALLEAEMKFQPNLQKDPNYFGFIISLLNNAQPAFISTVADNIDSLFFAEHKVNIEQTISASLQKFGTDPNFYESTISLLNLSLKYDSIFATKVAENVSKTDISALNKFLKRNKLPFNTVKEELNDVLSDKLIGKAFSSKFAEITTSKGIFEIELLPEYAPISCGNFISLAEVKYFDKLIFHRVVPGFVIQGGDPTGTGWGGPGYSIKTELSPLSFEVGALGMASAGKDTEGSQWFVMQGNYYHLNGNYTLFAKLVKPTNVIYNIGKNDIIYSIKLK